MCSYVSCADSNYTTLHCRAPYKTLLLRIAKVQSSRGSQSGNCSMQVGKAPMLLVDGQPVIRDAACHATTSLILRLAELASVRSQIEQFLTAGPPALARIKTVHVLQGEYAVMDAAHEPQPICLCSSEATTCCILALSCQSSGRVGMVHFDQPGKEQAKCLFPLLHGMLEPDLYIVGGFTEATECGHRTADSLLSSLEDTDLPVHVRLACIGQLNTTVTGAPRCCSLALNRTNVGMSAAPVADGTDKGPQAVQRLARLWTRSAPDCQNIYDTTAQTLRVPNISRQLSRQQVQTFRALLDLPDDHFLSFVSTSPEHEADAFVPETRAVFEWLLERCEEVDAGQRDASTYCTEYKWLGRWQLLES